jgi:hypothetical protein
LKIVFIPQFLIILLLPIIFISASQNGDLPAPGNNKVAYYVFDSGGPDHYSLTTFSDRANIVVLFEGKLWELADSVHYATGYMRNVNYQFYSEILRDIRILQTRGVKVLMNVDDAPSWSTDTPFTTFDGINYNYKQFAEFIKYCAIDVLKLDGISLDIEHKATGNTQYINLLTEIGKYFGPLSSDSSSQIFAAAIYSGGAPGYVIGQHPEVASYFNFVMDMGYWQSYITRFNQWANFIGASKVMVGVLNDYYNINTAVQAAAWQPVNPPKAGIMVYAANNLKSYTDSVFSSLIITSVDKEVKEPNRFSLMQNYPNPFNPSTSIKFSIPEEGKVNLSIYNILGQKIITLVNYDMRAGKYEVKFDASRYASGVYLYRLEELGSAQFTQIKKMILIK